MKKYKRLILTLSILIIILLVVLMLKLLKTNQENKLLITSQKEEIGKLNKSIEENNFPLFLREQEYGDEYEWQVNDKIPFLDKIVAVDLFYGDKEDLKEKRMWWQYSTYLVGVREKNKRPYIIDRIFDHNVRIEIKDINNDGEDELLVRSYEEIGNIALQVYRINLEKKKIEKIEGMGIKANAYNEIDENGYIITGNNDYVTGVLTTKKYLIKKDSFELISTETYETRPKELK